MINRATTNQADAQNFDEVILPNRAAGYRLACRLMRNAHDAEDAVQEATLRAFRYFGTFDGRNARAWFLSIVRNTCHGWHSRGRQLAADAFDENQHSVLRTVSDRAVFNLPTDDAIWIKQAMRHLPHRSRELLVRREVEGHSYRELSDALGIPIGTVMSGLSRARQALCDALDTENSGTGRSKRSRLPRRNRHVPFREEKVSR